ncbi:hypothetical protein AtubIFM55763_009954 [Aspergillus tubingensis]|uniref:Uncharacterized protein n=1 Tax=Aspergillus tubingensis TaxID=5068 RepID=A0A8H3XWQ5_ASPTU|nr:uncharacterized protein AtWU_03726 [Aspergillus tubingensis]GFN13927.1 hypothetical protein AtWU_03726 [Aspergillus tubingensis]GLA66973.1 hypothetical protein AtubIFM54640_009565 [Aspergillus tubingensis]GLA77764.1 hypothetical protein AtubIFM55763_009954 [Aspergillus tubingensis]GLA80843.1 hypothetical protein AtubIFM56815_004474 [Aspergillus tubingensis]GLB01469.1 hypothetical protein AtubIFM57143_011457 [Aspergillus tubingensis]
MTSTGGITGETSGGFLPPTLPSPAPSTPRPSTPSLLPKPRTHPLRAGSAKEATVINHIDTTLLKISRRHAKKFSSAYYKPTDDGDGFNSNARGYSPESFEPRREGEGEVQGYESFKEVARDLEGLVDVLWVSGTPSLQIPYLISLAIQVNSYLPEYPFSAAPTFRLLRKLDEVFAELLGGGSSGNGEKKSVVSMTEKVRIKSIAESCRVLVVEKREKEIEDANGAEEDDYDEDEDEEFEDVYGDANKLEDYMPVPGKWEMETAKVYERTIQLLGDELGNVGEFCDEDLAAGDGGVCDTGDFVVELEDDDNDD